MKSLLMRTGSMPVLKQNRLISRGTKMTSLSRQNSVESLSIAARKLSINVGMRRVSSESEVVRSERISRSKPSPTRIPEDNEEEQGFNGDGNGNGNRGGDYGYGNGYGYDDRSKIGEYYREMLKSDPNNSLLLMNYGKFLYEVEGDVERAEEYYGRAILTSPGDGEVLSMYGKLIWENYGDEERAQCYFDQALIASPEDCMVLGSYANFMWEAEDDKEDVVVAPGMVSAV